MKRTAALFTAPAARLAAIAAVLVASLAAPSSASAAAPFAYDEAVHGDLPGAGLLPILALGAGANTVTGTLGGAIPPDNDMDGFAFTLAPGQTFLGGTFALDDVPGTGNFQAAGWQLVTGDTWGAGTYVTDVVAASPGTGNLPAGAITAPGTYHLDHTFYGGDLGSYGTYIWTLNVVPEPASATLLALSAGGLALRRRRRR